MSSKCQLSRVTEQLEGNFCEFYFHVLRKLYDFDDSEFLEDVEYSLKCIRQLRNPKASSAVAEKIPYQEEAYRCAYMYAYNLIHSVLVYDHFLQFLKLNRDIRQKLTQMKRIRLCCLGGGPAPEVVAICKAIDDVLQKFGSKEQPLLNVYITIIDECEEWKNDASVILEEIGKDSFLYKSDCMKIHLQYIKADLIHPFTADVRYSIEKANIVTMVKFLSDVNNNLHSKHHLNIRSMVNDILENMRVGGCLFYLDSAGGGIFKEMDRMIDQYPFCSKLYGPCLYNQHVLDINTMEKHFELYEEFFGRLACTNRVSISCSTWIKIKLSDDEYEVLWNPAKKQSLNLKKKDRKSKVKNPNTYSKVKCLPESSEKPENINSDVKQNKFEKKRIQSFLKDAKNYLEEDDMDKS